MIAHAPAAAAPPIDTDMPAKTSIDTVQFKNILRRNVTLPMVVGLASALAFVAFVMYFLSVMTWVDHTQQVIGKTNELMTLSADMESGTRGFALSGQDSFLAPYQVAKPLAASEIRSLIAMVSDNPVQVDRLKRVAALQESWNAYAQTLIDARRQKGDYEALVRSEVGKQLSDRIRAEFNAIKNTESSLLKARNDTARDTTWWGVALYVLFIAVVNGFIAFTGRRDVTKLSADFQAALKAQVDAAEDLEEQAWVRTGQTRLAEQLIGQQTLATIGLGVLGFSADYLGPVVAAMYVRDDAGRLQRVSTHGFEGGADAASAAIEAQAGLVGQALRDGRLNHVGNLRGGYFKVVSGLGDTVPAEIVVAPTHNDGVANGVIELGFMRPVAERDLELLRLIAGSIGASLDAALYRKRLQDAVEETQQLNEELQVQQEELRTANEELGEQSRVLTESQTHLEHQQAELEATNTQLAEQAHALDRKNEALNEAQAALQERADELQRASRYKSEFLANMSHELRTPLNSSLILAKLLSENRDGNLNEEQLKFAQTIYGAGNDLLNLINDILDLSKVEAGRLELQPQFVSVHRLVEALQRTFTPLADDKRLAFEAHVRADAPVSMVTDNQRVEQILKNLLSNAIKFTEAGTVSISVEPRPEDRVAFVVKDSGIGIPAGQQDIIFEAFRQADGTINRRYGGTGLGLSISRELARLLGGTIGVESAAGQGSTFTLTLPARWTDVPEASVEDGLPMHATSGLDAAAARGATVRVRAPAPAPAPAVPAAVAPRAVAAFVDDRDDRDAAGAGKGRVLLVVEDDADFAGVLYNLAHEMRYRCLVAQTANEALELATSHLPNAILLDVRLPDDSGLSVLQFLKDDPRTRHIPVHIVAGEDFSEIALHMGAIGFAVKPTTRAELQGIFQRLEDKGAKKVKRVLVVEDDARQRDSVVHLIKEDDIEIAAVETGAEALALLKETVYDCMIIDLKLPDMDGSDLLERMTMEDICSFPPVIVYTGRNLTREEEANLNRYSRSIIIKGARSPERLLDEVTLFLHTVESQLSAERQTMLRTARNREKVFEGRKVLLVDDDVRNIFALASALEQKGLQVEIGRNGFEALAKLAEVSDIDLVLMDVMMPGMDGLEATRRIRANPKFAQLPVIAVTAKAMKDDQEQCRRAGANDYLAKPIDLDRLFSLMRVWMPSIERI
jgi:signal transduction histidine kinase/DNA-binding response OmpR family regulator/CHASE3 domain sensor protein